MRPRCQYNILSAWVSSPLSADYLDAPWVSREYREEATEGEKVRDFIAGMTDRYFAGAFRAVTLPERVRVAYRKG